MIRVIIVDDEILLRVGIQSFIDGKSEVSVSGVFETAIEAIEFLRNNVVDIVITDIEMAEMSGLEFIRIIRKEKLAEGVIILSSHDNFSYAQEAISMGTDSYLLKHNVSEESLLKEIHKIHKKIRANSQRITEQTHAANAEKQIAEDGKYVVGVVRAHTLEAYGSEGRQTLEGNMLVHLLEGIVQKYQMGTLFAPYNKELFIVFTFPKNISETELQKLMDDNTYLITKNIKQYVNGKISYGISTVFDDLKQMREKYNEALEAVEWSFYDQDKGIFYWNEPADFSEPLVLSCKYFMDSNGMNVFENELSIYMKKAHFYKMNVKKHKEHIIQTIILMMHQIMKESNVNVRFLQKWHSDPVLISEVTNAVTEHMMLDSIVSRIVLFRKELLQELDEDKLALIFTYIEKNLKEKITLEELADIACMSIPTFCRKFKDRTGMTLVQYMNEKRINRAKLLMKNQSLSLDQIGESVGFNNANYLIRVFKKITGQTVSEYRSQFGMET